MLRYNVSMDPITRFLADRRSSMVLVLLVFVLGIVGIRFSAASNAETTGGRVPAPRHGFLAPDFNLETLEGQKIHLADLRGQIVVINLWASWCPPCRAEMPAIQAVYDAYGDRGVEILAVNMTYQDNLARADAFVRELALNFPILLDRTGLVGNLYQMRALPTTFFLDREGVIQHVVVGGPMSELTLQSKISELLALD